MDRRKFISGALGVAALPVMPMAGTTETFSEGMSAGDVNEMAQQLMSSMKELGRYPVINTISVDACECLFVLRGNVDGP